MTELVFKCPRCGHDKLECIQDAQCCTPIEVLDDEVNYGVVSLSDSEILRFQCVNCGWVVKDEISTAVGQVAAFVTSEDRLIDWLRSQQSSETHQ